MYAKGAKSLKAKTELRKAGLEVLSIRRTRKEKVLLVLKKGGELSAFREELDQAIGEKAEISALVSTRSLEIRDLDGTVEKEEVVSVLCLALDRPVTRCFRWLGYGHGSQGCGNPDRKNACWRCGTTGHLARSCKASPKCLTCLDRGDKDIAHVSGSGCCPVFREELWRLRGRN